LGFTDDGERLQCEGSSIKMERLKAKILIVAAIFVTIIVGPSIIAWQAMEESALDSERAIIAGDILGGYEQLEDRANALLAHLRSGEVIGSERGRKLLADIFVTTTRIRQLISAEVSLIGNEGAAEEAEELERIDAIEQNVNKTIQGLVEPKWQALINIAIAEEMREIDEIQADMRSKVNVIRSVLILESLLSLMMAILLIYWFRNRIFAPIAAISRGAEEISDGNLFYRVTECGDPDLRKVQQIFNAMATQLEDQHKKAESEQDSLEALVEARTTELVAAKDALEALVGRRSNFLADISHELRTPLAIIRGEAEVTLRAKSAQPAEYRESLMRVVGQAESMGHLVDDLLFVARNDAGMPKLTSAKVDLHDLLNNAARAMRPLIEADGGSVTLNAMTKSAPVMGDKQRLGQVLTILIDNAIRYSSDAPVIELDLLSSPGGYRILVRDKGIGIPAAELPHVFDRFLRGTDAGAQNGEGHGLGLPLAKAIVDAHGGAITLESDAGTGTTASVFLPMAEKLRTVA
jgi:two-component system, OmpR family, sensor kinase